MPEKLSSRRSRSRVPFVTAIVFLFVGVAVGWISRGAFWQGELNAAADRLVAKTGGVYVPELNLILEPAPEAAALLEADRERAQDLILQGMQELNRRSRKTQ
jgi:hypothetical protein